MVAAERLQQTNKKVRHTHVSIAHNDVLKSYNRPGLKISFSRCAHLSYIYSSARVKSLSVGCRKQLREDGRSVG